MKSNLFRVSGASFFPPATKVRALARLALLSLMTALTANVLCAQGNSPVNDNFGNRTALTGTNVTVSTDNRGATREPNEPDHAGGSGGSSVWWSWKAPANGEIKITTDGSSIDTLLGVYVGSTLASLSVIASNDDQGDPFIIKSTSRVRFEVISGTEYQIAVDGYDGEQGNIQLSLSFLSEPITRPSNDNFANAAVLSGDSVLTEANNINATPEPDEPLHTGQPGDTSVWWTWTSQSSGPMTLSTAGSDFDTMLAVYTGSSMSTLTLIASNDDATADTDTSSLTFQAAAGQTYRFAVDGYLWSSGQIRLQLSQIKEVNAVPVLPSLGTQGVLEMSLLIVTNTATEANTNSTVGYRLQTHPSGASIDARGIITWTPSEADGPGSFTITTVATSTNILDTTNPYLSATNSFDVIVNEVNVAPVLKLPPDQTISVQTTLSVSASATDADLPANPLTFALVSAPAGMTINATTGLITWTPNASQAPSTNVIQVSVKDVSPNAINASSLSTTNSFKVTVNATVISAPILSVSGLTSSTVTLSWTAVSGRTYRVQYKSGLDAAAWFDLPGDIVASGNTASKTDNIAQGNRFYRVALLP